MNNDTENNELWLKEAMIEFDKKFHKYVLNILNGHAGSGKSTYIFEDFLLNTTKYIDGLKLNYINNLDRVLYVCDTNMLKSSILKETEDKCITKILEKGDLKKAMENKSFQQMLEGDTGYIKVITYSTLSFLLENEASRKILLKYYNCIIMDEMHNLFKYANRFDSEKSNTYTKIIQLLPTLVLNVLVIGISATPHRIYQGIKLREIKINTNTIFRDLELKRIRKYKDVLIHEFAFMINEIKWLGHIIEPIKNKYKYKILIYTNTVGTCEKYKKILISYGYNVEWLCSVNNKIVNEKTGKSKSRMNKKQLKIKDNLVNTGMLPDDLDVLIVNGAYETGWNLRDDRVQMVIVDSLDFDTQIQSRNRVRHDIEFFRYKVPVDSDGQIIDYDQYKNEYASGRGIIQVILASGMEEKYIGVKLSKENKEYLVDRYALQWYGKKSISWQTFKYDLDRAGLIAKTNLHGTYIYKKDDVKILEDKVVEVKKMNNEDKFIDWIENEWDKKRISIQDVKDILDIGTTSFNKMIKSESIVNYFKENRYNIGTVKGGKVKYLKKY